MGKQGLSRNRIALLMVASVIPGGMLFADNPIVPSVGMADPHIGRKTRTFNLGWKFKTGDIPGVHRKSFDDSTWKTVQVPHDWMIALPFSKDNAVTLEHYTKYVRWTTPGTGSYLPLGKGCYRKRFRVPPDSQGKTILLEFDGIYCKSNLFLNGKHMMFWRSGYNSFACNITDFVDYENDNVLAITVDASQKDSWWYDGGGIYRPVRMVITDKVHVAYNGTFITTADISQGAATLNLTTEVVNDRDKKVVCTLETAIVDRDGQKVATLRTKKAIAASVTHAFEQDVVIEAPTLWDIDNPYLYKAISTVTADSKMADTYETTFGIRTFHFDPDEGFFLNGKRYKLHGVCEHDDIGPLGTAVPTRVHYRKIELLKKAGVNFLRCSHNPPSPETLDACDRMGLMVWNETRYFGNDPFELDMLRNLIRRDRNHPSVFAWSMGNEEILEGTPEGVEILTAMHELAKCLDPTRVTAIPQAHSWNQNCFSDITDIMGYNWRDAAGGADEDHTIYPQRVKLCSEYNFVSGKVDEFIVRDYFAGLAMWTGFSYRGGLPWPHNDWPGHLGDLCHFPMERYYLYQAQFTDKPVLYLDIKNGWKGKKGDNLYTDPGYSNCQNVDVYINDRLVKTVKPDGDREMVTRDGFLLTEDVTINSFIIGYEPDSVLRLVGKKDGKKVCEKVIRESGPASKIILEPLTGRVAADGEDVTLVGVYIADDNDNILKDADSRVTLFVHGAGALVGFGNADNDLDKTAIESVKSNTKTTCQGKALAVIRSTGRPGKIVVYANSESGLESTELVIEAAEGIDPTQTTIASPRKAPVETISAKNEYIISPPVFAAGTVKAGMETEIVLQAENISSAYPLELRMSLDGEMVANEVYAVDKTHGRNLVFVCPAIYREGQHDLVIDCMANSRSITSFTRIISIEPTEASLSYGQVKAPSYVIANETFTVSTTVQNMGTRAATDVKIPFVVNDKVLHTRACQSIQGGEQITIGFEYKLGDQKTADFRIGDTQVRRVYLLQPLDIADDRITLHGEPRLVSARQSNGIKMDGIDDYIEISPIDLKERPFTLTAWVKVDDFNLPHQEAPLFGGGHGEQNKGLHVGVRSKKPFMGFWGDDLQGNRELQTGQWTFLAFVLEAVFHERQTGPDTGPQVLGLVKEHWDIKKKIYINGELHVERESNFYLGTVNHIGTFWGHSKYNGLLDDVRIFDKALSEQEIKAIYLDDEVSRENLVLWLSFD